MPYFIVDFWVFLCVVLLADDEHVRVFFFYVLLILFDMENGRKDKRRNIIKKIIVEEKEIDPAKKHRKNWEENFPPVLDRFYLVNRVFGDFNLVQGL